MTLDERKTVSSRTPQLMEGSAEQFVSEAPITKRTYSESWTHSFKNTLLLLIYGKFEGK